MARVETKRSVGRPREFDEEAALKAAMDAFWKKGYEATSLRDLCTCTCLHRGSLYQTFGDKHQLFMQALAHYAETEFRELAAVAFQHESPLAAVRAVAHTACAHAREGKGCMLINSVVELAPHDAEVRDLTEREAKRRLRVLTEFLVKARDLGEIRAELEPEALAKQLMVTLAGSAALVKGFITTEELDRMLDGIIDLWT